MNEEISDSLAIVMEITAQAALLYDIIKAQDEEIEKLKGQIKILEKQTFTPMRTRANG